MRVVTTFNDDLYETSGKSLLDSIATHLPDAEILVYHELDRNPIEFPGVVCVNCPNFILTATVVCLVNASADEVRRLQRAFPSWELREVHVEFDNEEDKRGFCANRRVALLRDLLQEVGSPDLPGCRFPGSAAIEWPAGTYGLKRSPDFCTVPIPPRSRPVSRPE